MASENIIEEKKQGQALITDQVEGNKKKLFIESYGCQMNLNDSEIVASILAKEGFNTTHLLEEADLVLVNTCSIREKAEQTIRKRLQRDLATSQAGTHCTTSGKIDDHSVLRVSGKHGRSSLQDDSRSSWCSC